jgi:predicted house-cleaning noncanonical NTP pyrophosphatase (MazG superfamily)
MRQTYDKLVRDRIPEIVHASGRTCETRTLAEDEYRAALRAKLIEEAEEAATASPGDLPSELADLLEVIEATIVAHGLARAAVEEERRQRRLERGGFELRIQLLWTD